MFVVETTAPYEPETEPETNPDELQYPTDSNQPTGSVDNGYGY